MRESWRATQPDRVRRVREVCRWAIHFPVTQCRLWQMRSQLRKSSPPLAKSVGLAVITYNRLDFLKNCTRSLDRHQWGHADVRVVVDDSSDQSGYETFLRDCAQRGIHVIRLPCNQGVAAAKNAALRHLLERKCQYLFLMEDDMLLISSLALRYYIDWAHRFQIHHLNFGLHGRKNRWREMLIRHANDWLLCYPSLVGAFSFYTARAVNEVGYLDERFRNALEHVEHTYRIAKAGLTTPFWCFADHPLNTDLLREQPGSLTHSVIRNADWSQRLQEAREYWIAKHGGWLPERPY